MNEEKLKSHEIITEKEIVPNVIENNTKKFTEQEEYIKKLEGTKTDLKNKIFLLQTELSEVEEKIKATIQGN